MAMPSMPTNPARAWCSFLFPQEVEILSSDSEAGAIDNGGGIRDSGDEHSDSDLEDSSSGPCRKRSKQGQPSRGRDDGAVSTKPASRSNLGKNKKPPTAGKQKRHPAKKDPRQPERLPDRSDTGGSSSQEAEVEPLNGSASKVGADSSLAVLGGRATAEDQPSTAVVNTGIFDLQENAKRRNAFQAGLKASLPDDEDRSIAAAAEGGSEGDRISGAGAPSSDGGASAEGSSTASISRGKGKGAAAGRVKLTPMEQQVVDLKAKHSGVLLLVECGYRYRFFGEDALAAAKVRATSSIRFGARTLLGPVFQCRRRQREFVVHLSTTSRFSM